jgi:hypothetical protein
MHSPRRKQEKVADGIGRLGSSDPTGLGASLAGTACSSSADETWKGVQRGSIKLLSALRVTVPNCKISMRTLSRAFPNLSRRFVGDRIESHSWAEGLRMILRGNNNVLAHLLVQQLPRGPFLRVPSELSVDIEIDFIDAGLPFGAWLCIPCAYTQLDLAEFLHGKATPDAPAFWNQRLGNCCYRLQTDSTRHAIGLTFGAQHEDRKVWVAHHR